MPKQFELGSNFYLFTADDAGKGCDTLVITAHGGIWRGSSRTIHYAHGDLHYYSKHGVTTDDNGLERFKVDSFNESQRVETVIKHAKTYNYGLSKYQGRHGNENETYESIMRDSLATFVPKKINAIGVGAQGFERYNTSSGTFDILTVRNRYKGLTTGVNLQRVFEELHNRSYLYKSIHCYFCRSFYI